MERLEIACRDFEAEFFTEFANQRTLGVFAGFDLSAWEFPETRHVFPFRPLLQQQTPIAPHQRRRGHDKQRSCA